MCGVIGYVGAGATPEFFFQGLKRLEYRGYDSAGIAAMGADGVVIVRAEGKLNQLECKLKDLPPKATVGIGHTRWATHGKPTETNAHPHRSGEIILLHNGIIENYAQLRRDLQTQGYVFHSETDTEAAAHLLHREYHRQDSSLPTKKRMQAALLKLIPQLHGAFAFGIICTDDPNTLFAVKQGSPLVLGIGNDETYLASGMTALVEHTRRMVVLEDGDFAILTPQGVNIFDSEGHQLVREPTIIDWSLSMIEKGGYRHYMLKEIHEHPTAVANTLETKIMRDSGLVNLADFQLTPELLNRINRVQLIACGTSYFACLAARYTIEDLCGIPVEVDIASEYRYRAITKCGPTLAIAVSQSGETADTLHAIRRARDSGFHTLAIVNTPGSTIGHTCHSQSLVHAGPEIGVASTKVYSAQLVSLLLIGAAIAQERSAEGAHRAQLFTSELVKAPSLMESVLGLSNHIEELANTYRNHTNFLFIGRGPLSAVAHEGALKLKEISYIHAEAYAGGELKHGPIALIDEAMPIVCLAPRDAYREKMISNIEEVRSRNGRILAVGSEDDEELRAIAHDYIPLPPCPPEILPLVIAVPLHLLAYWIAVKKGTDVDQPRNLAKSVTVE